MTIKAYSLWEFLVTFRYYTHIHNFYKNRPPYILYQFAFSLTVHVADLG
jgi:hypothetical protein